MGEVKRGQRSPGDGRTRNVGVYVRETTLLGGLRQREVFVTRQLMPLPEWGDVTCIHQDVEQLRDADAMVHACVRLGYVHVPMK